ncbi:hypothetical protein SynMITS9220_01351 [Synechococcus sp. MIT S9220]|nr:hypothetical protein SynMITS9220_01351 [Synechococcus sp. MIT S9220]
MLLLWAALLCLQSHMRGEMDQTSFTLNAKAGEHRDLVLQQASQ